jgi:hypothetical protein
MEPAEWPEGVRPEQVLRDRVECPSCHMRGAVFTVCESCGGPACDNCLNAGKGSMTCLRCQMANVPRPAIR